MYFLYMNSEVHLTWTFLHNNANSKSRSGRFKNIVVPALITRVFRTSHPLNRGPDSLWSLKIPGCPSKKSRGITQASWPNFPIGLWPSWPSNHPHIYWLASSLVSSPPVSWSVVGVLAQWLPSHHPDGFCTLVVDEITPFYVKRFEYPEKHYINVTNYNY